MIEYKKEDIQAIKERLEEAGIIHGDVYLIRNQQAKDLKFLLGYVDKLEEQLDNMCNQLNQAMRIETDELEIYQEQKDDNSEECKGELKDFHGETPLQEACQSGDNSKESTQGQAQLDVKVDASVDVALENPVIVSGGDNVTLQDDSNLDAV